MSCRETIEKNDSIKSDETWIVEIRSERDGRIVVSHGNVQGGFFIVHKKGDGDMGGMGGTNQGVFGTAPSIGVCLFKAPEQLERMAIKIGVHDAIKKTREMMEKL